MTVDLGLSLSSRSGMRAAQFAEYARLAEERSFSAVFATENNSDALALAQAMASATQRIAIGTAVINIFQRHPAAVALTAATVDDLSQGRFILGLGTANPGLNQGTLHLPDDSPVQRMREYVGVIRAILTGQPATYHGRLFQMDGFQAYRQPFRPNLPIFVGALLPRMLNLAGQVADGVMLNLCSPEQAKLAAATVRAGALQVGRDPATVEIACVLPCCVSDDEERARKSAAEVVLGYAWHPAASQLFASAGFEQEIGLVRRHLGKGDREAASREVTEKMLGSLVAYGKPAAARDRIQLFIEAGVDRLILFPVALDGDWHESIRGALGAFGQ